MTVTYTSKIATVKFQTLWRLLKRWKGSVYKNVWKDFVLFISLYFSLSFLYRVVLTESQKRGFEKVVILCNRESAVIPVAFVLGFYVTIVVNRWWDQLNHYIPWPDDFSLTVTAMVHGNDDRGRLMRRTLVRYVNLAWILTLCSISTVAKKRFPTLEHLVEIGMMTQNELEIFENIKTSSNKYYIPLVWATTLLSRARKENRITNDYALKDLLQLLRVFRNKLGSLFNYDWLSIPLVYTQVVTIAVQGYFFANVVGKQFLDPAQGYPGHEVDIVVPVFTILEFLFYMGWLKVAESLINPFGEDDDDFDTNWVLDRNIQVSYLIVDDMHSEHPELIKDAYWDSIDFSLPYTMATEQYKTEPYLGSTNDIELDPQEAQFVPLPPLHEVDEGEEPNCSVNDVAFARNTKSSPQRILKGKKTGSGTYGGSRSDVQENEELQECLEPHGSVSATLYSTVREHPSPQYRYPRRVNSPRQYGYDWQGHNRRFVTQRVTSDELLQERAQSEENSHSSVTAAVNLGAEMQLTDTNVVNPENVTMEEKTSQDNSAVNSNNNNGIGEGTASLFETPNFRQQPAWCSQQRRDFALGRNLNSSCMEAQMADSAGNTLSSANQRAAIASSAENCLTADQKARLTSDLLEFNVTRTERMTDAEKLERLDRELCEAEMLLREINGMENKPL